MNRTKAIKAKCLECAGDTYREVLLCVLFDCPLWEFRTGQDARSGGYQRRMLKLKEDYGEELEMLRKAGYDVDQFWRFPAARTKRREG